MPEAVRGINGYRHYGDTDLWRLIKACSSQGTVAGTPIIEAIIHPPSPEEPS